MSKAIAFIRASKNEEGTQLWVTGEIGVDVRFADLQRALTYYAEESTGTVTVNIYSHGGYLDDATAFYDWIADSGTKFKVRIWGTAMSAATVIAAAAGRENIEIAPNASWMIHETQGGTDEMRAIGNDALVRVYRTLTGKKEKEIRDMIAATTTLNATEAVKHGFAGKVMKSSMRLAAMWEAEAIDINEKEPAMAEEKKTITAKVKVKLTTMEAARAAFGDGTEVEVEVAPEEATAAAIEEKDARIAELEAENEALKAKAQEGEAGQEARAQLETEANAAKAALQAKEDEHVKAINDLKAAHEAAIAELKKPLAKKTVGDNGAPGVAEMPQAIVTASDKAAKVFAKDLSTDPIAAELNKKKA